MTKEQIQQIAEGITSGIAPIFNQMGNVLNNTQHALIEPEEKPEEKPEILSGVEKYLQESRGEGVFEGKKISDDITPKTIKAAGQLGGKDF